ncbi:hypothetical protein BAE44_0024617 [Dichanthelium oligosanthes]|uniref:Uncharacterized protein n=1 Tax=Dichanthelium oligosanthes TaxID=888268 RepID=A0A1E5UN99_9POAL|nr:hypothetical protein BAE44_0024617 [Dichanthelium oligosanthes]
MRIEEGGEAHILAAMEPRANLLLLPTAQGKRDGNDYPFWYRKEYMEVLANRRLGTASARAYHGARSIAIAESSIQRNDSKMKEEVGFSGIVSVKKEELIDICKEVVSLLKAICFLGVCMLVVMLLDVCVHLIK